MARFIATAVGYDNIAVRQPGDEFDLPDGSSAPWFKPAEGDTKGPAKAKAGGKKAEPAGPEVGHLAGDTIA